MQQYQNVSLKDYSTMRLGGNAAYVAEITSKEELKTSLEWADSQNLPVIMIGGGSNIIWKDEGFSGLVLVNKILRYEVLERDPDNIFITAGAGENWDSVVERTVQDGLTGIEALSLIPGTTGATPVQNVGAYGQEIADVFVSAEAYDRQAKKFIVIPKYECEFGYRMSKFKRSTERGRYFITAITLHLARKNPEPPFYQAIERYFAENGIAHVTPQVIRDTVIKIRSSKLPDPAVVSNNGSFFANPILDEGSFAQLHADHPGVVHWRLDNGEGVKVSAAWLIEQAGFKDFHDPETGMATWPTQPLVLVNETAKTTSDLLKFRDNIAKTVLQKYNVGLVQEPEILP